MEIHPVKNYPEYNYAKMAKFTRLPKSTQSEETFRFAKFCVLAVEENMPKHHRRF